MDENPIKQISFFKRVKWAIFNLENYEIFAIEKNKIAIFYFLKMVLIFALITSIGLTYKFANTDFENIEELQSIANTEIIEYIQNTPKIQLYTMFYSIATLYLFIMYIIITMVDVILLSILGYFTSKIARVFLRYSAIFNISVYAITLPLILNASYILINSFSGFEIKYFQAMYNTIAYIYLVTAILMIKSELIKQGDELAKLEEEQKQIREEIERQEDEKRQKEEQKKKEKEEEKRKKEKEKGNENPEGSSA